MSKSITLPAELPTHPIFLNTRRMLGVQGQWSLICLLAWCANHRPDGDLRGLDPAVIALASEWPDTDDAGAMLRALESTGALVFEHEGWWVHRTLVKRKVESKAPPCPVEQIKDAYERTLTTCPRVREMSAKARTHVTTAWKTAEDKQTLEWWADYFAYVRDHCPFLIGKGVGERPFFADFEWLVTPNNMAKVINGRYDKG